MPVRMIKISRRPIIIPIISTIRVALPVAGPVRPRERPTVPSAEANSNMASVKPQPAVSVSANVPTRIVMQQL